MANDLEKNQYYLHPGYIFFSSSPYLISTVLGSCVSVCIWDCVLNIGGMNHYMHARPFSDEQSGTFGSVSIPCLINFLIDAGSKKANLRAHIVGGAQSPLLGNSMIGKENIDIANEIVQKNNLSVITNDTGGSMGRKVIFDNVSGEIVIYKVNKLRKCDWYEDDKSFNN